MKNVRYEYVIENGHDLTLAQIYQTRHDARRWLACAKLLGYKNAKIIQRVYELKQERTVR